MADYTVPPTPPDHNPNDDNFASEFDSLQIPPLDSLFFSDGNDNNCLDIAADPFVYDAELELGIGENGDYELTFDDLEDLYFPSEADDFLVSDNSDQPANSFESSPDNPVQENPETAKVSHINDVTRPSLSASPGSGSSGILCDQSLDDCKFLNYKTSELRRSNDEYLQADSGSGNSKATRILNFPSPELSGEPASSQGSGNSDSGVSEARNCSSPDSECCDVIVDQKVKSEEMGKNYVPKRKKGLEEGSADLRSAKYRRSSVPADSTDPQLGFSATNGDEEKKKARLMRNRESAQLSRQRKKHYVEELEDKVRNMHSTISELNSRISYVMAENAGLRQQLSGGAMCQPPPPGMYPHPSMAYPWMPCAPYVVKSKGSQVPLVPIPRLKPQQPASVTKAKKNEGKRAEGKTKKVASVSLLGLLFFMMFFGGLVPMVNVKFGNIGDRVPGKLAFVSGRFYNQNQERVLRVDRYSNLSDGVGVGNSCAKSGTSGKLKCERGYRKARDVKFDQRGQGSKHVPDSDEFIRMGNTSEPLVASLYVPRNDKLVKIDGNLIIHSILASEKAMASRKASDVEKARETGLAIPRDLNPALAIPEIRGNGGKHPNVYRKPAEQRRALTSGPASSLKDHIKTTAADGKLQQWFREGLAGPMLSSGVCTEVFQFDVSSTSPGAIIPASSISNSSRAHHKNTTQLSKGRNRRILRGVPIPLGGSNFNATEEPVGNPRKNSFQGNKTTSSMVVSVLTDPREVGDSEVDGVITPKSLSRIFVVVLLDSVKYVTYSCGLPRTGPHVVSA